MPKSAYIHIPFCKSKCRYCTFVSFKKPELIGNYIEAITKEIRHYYNGEKLETLYFGGGTPSLILPEFISEIYGEFSFSKTPEITLELNPDDITKEYLRELKNIGINRLSIGSQTFDDRILKLIGRRHDSEQIIKGVNFAKEVGFKNISLDLIYGLPAQNVDGLRQDLNKFIKLGIQHVSTYGLKIEKGAYFAKNIPNNLPDSDTQADMYELINSVLEKEGFYRYEVSNFAQKGYESRHNLNYWNNGEYYGFGVSAHGYINRVRYSETEDLNEYLINPIRHKTEKLLSLQECLEEEIFLGFRKTEGVDVESINRKFNIDFETKYGKILTKYSDYIKKTKNGYALTLQGTLLSNEILSEFISV